MENHHDSRNRRLVPLGDFESLRMNVETVDGLDVSMLFLRLDFRDFQAVLKELAQAYEERTRTPAQFALVFSLDDPDFADSEHKKVLRLRQLKALMETPKLSSYIKKIVVKGREADRMIEPNVFSSGVTFTPI